MGSNEWPLQIELIKVLYAFKDEDGLRAYGLDQIKEEDFDELVEQINIYSQKINASYARKKMRPFPVKINDTLNSDDEFSSDASSYDEPV